MGTWKIAYSLSFWKVHVYVTYHDLVSCGEFFIMLSQKGNICADLVV